MPGRNDPCPCGSGRKYKKCCLLDKAPNAKVKAGPPQSRYLNYAELAKIVSIDELPLIGVTSGASAKIFLNDLIEYIESETDIEVAWFSNEEGGRAFEFTFNTNRSGDDYYNDDYYNDDCDSDDDENSEISVLIDEKSFAGSLQSAALQDGDPVEIADVLFEVNASLYMVWQALAQTPQARGKNKLAPQLLSVIAQVREGFEKLTAERDSKIKQNELIFANLAQTRLDSMLVLLSSKFADETSSHDLQSKFPLPESTQLSKTPPLLDPCRRRSAACRRCPRTPSRSSRPSRTSPAS